MLCKRTCLVLPIHWIFPDLFWRVFLIWQLTCSVWPSRTRNSASWPSRQSWGLLFSVLTFNSISAVSRKSSCSLPCWSQATASAPLPAPSSLPDWTRALHHHLRVLCNTRLPDNHEKLTMIWWSSWDIVDSTTCNLSYPSHFALHIIHPHSLDYSPILDSSMF